MSFRFWKERSAVYIVTVHETFIPSSPWAWPDTFGFGAIHVKNVTLSDARATVRAYNKAALEKRSADVAKWDRSWAIACSCVRGKGLDRDDQRPERQHLSRRPRGYTEEEVRRLLDVCNLAWLPALATMSAGDWWTGLINTVLSTGIRPVELLKKEDAAGGLLFPWPHAKTAMYTTFRELLLEAEIEPTGHHLLHGLRQTYIERQLQKGGAA